MNIVAILTILVYRICCLCCSLFFTSIGGAYPNMLVSHVGLGGISVVMGATESFNSDFCCLLQVHDNSVLSPGGGLAILFSAIHANIQQLRAGPRGEWHWY